MDLFGHNILDFSSEDENVLLGDLPRVSECQYMSELGIDNLNEESNDSALGSADSLSSDTCSEVRSSADLDILQDEDSYLNTTVSFDQVLRTVKKEAEPAEDNCLDFLECSHKMMEMDLKTPDVRESSPREGSTTVPDVENFQSHMKYPAQTSFNNISVEDEGMQDSIFDIFNQMEAVEMKPNLQSDKTESDDTDTNFKLFGDLCLEQEEEVKQETDTESPSFDDLLKSMFDVSDETDQNDDYDELLTSILSSEVNIDPDYFENFYPSEEFDIDSVDPACLKMEEEEEEVEVKAEVGADYVDYTALVMRDHDYTLPPTSSLLLTPPHSPADQAGPEKTTTKPRNQIVKFNQSKDLKFVINLPVKKGVKLNARSILKKKILQNDSQSKSARDLVREILEKRSLPEHIEEKREFVKSMKRRMREESVREQSESGVLKSKYRCLENVIKSDSKKYRKFQEERELHNSMERQRRIEMKEAYDCLKGAIPNIASKDKVSKLNILNTAKDYCHGLEGKLERLETIHQREEARHRQLLEQLNMLKLQIL